MQHYVNMADYGNKEIGNKIDRFWLNDDLKITMEEQIVFLRKLYKNSLSFSYKNQKRVKGIMEYATIDSTAVIRAKTGWSVPSEDAQQIGWIVGWVEKADNKGYYFALNIDINEPEDAKAREAILMDVLKSMKIIH